MTGSRLLLPAHCLLAILRGVGQIVFQDNALTGAIFLVGMAIGSPLMATGGLVASAIGTLVALLLRYDRKETQDGIYGFNAALVGFGTLFFLQPTLWAWGLLIAGSIISTVLCHFLRKIPWPTYTTPFILTTWGLVIAARRLALPFVEAVTSDEPAAPFSLLELMREAASGMSEIMLEAGAMTGVLFLIGIAINNWRHAVLAFAGSIVGTILAHYHHDPEKSIMIGIYGYNAALTAIAVFLWRPSLIAALLGAALTVPLIEYFPGVVSPLTAPFVIASWIVLFIGIVIEPRFGPSPIAGR